MLKSQSILKRFCSNFGFYISGPIITKYIRLDAKVREKERRQAEKDAGIERIVTKRKKIMEDHRDDCGEHLSSLHDGTTSALTCPCDYDTDDALSDNDRNQCLLMMCGTHAQTYPIDVSRVAQAQHGGVDTRGRD